MESFNFNNESINQLEKVLKKEFNITNQIKTEKVVINEDLEKIEKERKILAEKLIS
jgi:flagellar biosynthesis/type III secretory pathway chaperone